MFSEINFIALFKVFKIYLTALSDNSAAFFNASLADSSLTIIPKFIVAQDGVA